MGDVMRGIGAVKGAFAPGKNWWSKDGQHEIPQCLSFFGWTCDEFAPKTRYPCIMISLVFRPVSIFI
jgi:hypothetical protein